MKKLKKLLLIAMILAMTFAVSISFIGCEQGFLEGEKSVTCYVVKDLDAEYFCYILINDAKIENLEEKNYTKYTCETSATNLKAVFDDLEDNTDFTYEATEFSFGVQITKICNVSEDETNGKYIMFKINGDGSPTGIADTFLTDKAVYSFYLGNYS